MKGMLFAAYFVNLMAAYLAFKSAKKHNNKLSSIIFYISIAHLVVATIFTVNLIYSQSPWLMNSAPLVWFLLILGLVIEVFSLFKKNIAGQYLAASIHLFLILPTIFSIGLFILLLAIVELIIAFLMFYKTRAQWVAQ